MDNSYFKRPWNSFAPRYQPSPIARQVPVYRQAVPSPQVVAIPVHFIGSERRRPDSALKIQKAFRGFLVRKNVKKIAAIKGEVDEIERWISTKEKVELMRREAKERLKVNETLMSLLFRLDSVKGVDSGVRDFRRAVIKKAIALQERVENAIADEDDQTLGDDSGADNGVLKIKDSGEGNEDGEKPQTDETLELQSSVPEAEEVCNSNTPPEAEVLDDGTVNLQSFEGIAETGFNNPENVNENKEIVGDGSEEEDASGSNYVSPYNRENPVEGVGENKVENQEEEEDGMEIVKVEDEGGNGVGFGDRDREENKRSRELLERMVEDNEKMMGMMADLFERNEMQTRMLSSLSHRVEQLERAFLCEALRRRKRRHAAAEK